MKTTLIGSGVAAWTLARELRKADPEHEIELITQGNGDVYSKPMLSNALASGKTAQTLVMTSATKMAEQLNVKLHAQTGVTAINPETKTIQRNNTQYTFDQLVLCVGANPIRLNLSGSGAKDVLSVNHLDDYGQFREQLEGKTAVALIGAGLIGCEFANDLRCANIAVSVYDLADRPLPKLLPMQASQFLAQKLAEAGVNWKLGRTIVAIEKVDDGYEIIDSEGKTETVGLVLSAVGLQPHTELAQGAGLEVDRGIVVDALGQTNEPNIYALGDCAQYNGEHVLPYIMPVMQAARAMAKTLTGQNTPIRFPAMPVNVKTPACPTVISSPPPQQSGHWEVECLESGVKGLFKSEDGTTLGIALLGDATKERQSLVSQLPALQP